MKRAVPFGVMRNGMISNRTRGSCLAISDGNADGNSVQKCGISNQPDICIGFRVSSTFGQSDGDMSGTPKTMGGLSIRPNCTPS